MIIILLLFHFFFCNIVGCAFVSQSIQIFWRRKKKFRVSKNLVNAHMKQKNYINDSILEVMTH